MINSEIRNRIRLAVYAYAYEVENESLISDSEYDKLSLMIEPQQRTGNRKMDKFFRDKFDPSTGQWIHKHPELNKIKKLYEDYYRA